MVTNETRDLRSGGLPAGRQQGAQVILVGHCGQAGEEVLEIGERILSMAFAGDDQRVEDGRALSGIGVPDEQPVLHAAPQA